MIGKLIGLTFILAQGAMCYVPLSDFFPFGSLTNDISLPRADDLSSPPISLSVPFPFFDNLHTTAWVNINGGISFLQAIATYTPTCAPMSLNMRMVMGFWADVDLRNTDAGDGFYRQSTDANLLRKAADEVVSAFPGNAGISLKWMLIATWNAVTFYGQDTTVPSSLKKRNTFQIILTTDGIKSFALFYYNNITWTTGTASGGSPTTGLGGSPARAGFDAGDGTTLFVVPGSCTNDIVNIDDTSNYGKPGKWIFRIDNDIKSAGCNNNGTASQKLQILPVFVDIWGNVPIQLIGPCFKATDNVTCIFIDPYKGPIRVAGVITMTNSMAQGYCKVPFMSDVGRITVQMLLNQGYNSIVSIGTLYIVSPVTGLGVKVSSVNAQSVAATSVTEIPVNFTWNPQAFAPGTDQLTLSLYIYSNVMQEWQKLRTLTTAVPNTGTLLNLRIPANYLNTGEIMTSAAAFSLENVAVPTVAGFRNLIVSDIDAVVGILKEWLSYVSPCDLWYAADSGPPTDLIPCPPALFQAQQDPRYAVDEACPQSPCPFHPGVDVCYRSRASSPSGGGQQCCYVNGFIKVGPPGGGTADKRHSSNLIFHFIQDVLPWLLCCYHRTTSSQCLKYYEKRPSNNGIGYIFPRPAGGRGDPHISTFDGLSYTFNGAGEFWMVKNTSTCPISIQARMEIYAAGTSQASVFTAFALKDGSSPVLMIRYSSIRKMDVFLGEELLDFSDPLLLDQRFLNMQLSMSSDFSRISVDLQSGVSVIVKWGTEALSVVSLCDNKLRGKTSGLLGIFDGNTANDLTGPDNVVVSPNATMSNIHSQFGMKWIVQERESLFQYTPGKPYSYYYKPSFLPSFVDVSLSNVSAAALAACGTVRECLYDFVTTGSVAFANETRAAVQQFNQIVQTSAVVVVVCPTLRTPTNGAMSADSYFPGSTATFNCSTGYDLVGSSKLVCSATGTWNGTEPVCQTARPAPPQSDVALRNNPTTIIVLVAFALAVVACW